MDMSGIGVERDHHANLWLLNDVRKRKEPLLLHTLPFPFLFLIGFFLSSCLTKHPHPEIPQGDVANNLLSIANKEGNIFHVFTATLGVVSAKDTIFLRFLVGWGMGIEVFRYSDGSGEGKGMRTVEMVSRESRLGDVT
jgi:hypothetical protein